MLPVAIYRSGGLHRLHLLVPPRHSIGSREVHPMPAKLDSSEWELRPMPLFASHRNGGLHPLHRDNLSPRPFAIGGWTPMCPMPYRLVSTREHVLAMRCRYLWTHRRQDRMLGLRERNVHQRGHPNRMRTMSARNLRPNKPINRVFNLRQSEYAPGGGYCLFRPTQMPSPPLLFNRDPP